MKLLNDLRREVRYARAAFRFDKRIPPPSDFEKKLIRQLRQRFKHLPPSLPSPSWASFARELKELVLTSDPRAFLRWKVIQNTMFMANPPYLAALLQELQSSEEWLTVWCDALTESPYGFPPLSPLLPQSSGNLIVHAFHLLQLHKATRLEFDQLERVIEFGGGYGSMCRLFRRLGFKGAYVIYDLPEFSYLQEFYLQGLGLPVVQLTDQDLKGGGNYLATDTARLKHVSPKPDSKSLFVATFSLSESPVQLRQDILSLTQDCRYYLFAYQGQFDEVDNIAFFEEQVRNMPSVQWTHRVYDLFEGHYLLGKRYGDLNGAM
jgi:hypothetical protein